MKTIICLIAVFVIITSAFAAGTADNLSNIQNNRTSQIDAQIESQF